MTPTEPDATTADLPNGPVVFAYDGCELSQLAIKQAARQLAPGGDALVVCVWQPGDVGFVPVGEQHFDASNAAEVRAEAERTVAQGAALAEQAGFRVESLTIEESTAWKALVQVAEERKASLIVLGSHRRSGLRGHLLGSVAAAVVQHSETSVLVVHKHS